MQKIVTNSIAPGRRPLSSMVPTIVLKEPQLLLLGKKLEPCTRIRLFHEHLRTRGFLEVFRPRSPREVEITRRTFQQALTDRIKKPFTPQEIVHAFVLGQQHY